eukprot:Unigene5120_Nuclearia_a/m.15714 Unigene5120_Nuclearia_a/g.15714  ORF Unigene5120_Nuclearia_a/g.15714 Unigene5120_Nuclearia_a/m.15714 type:complete len:323 (+) Unigene5120_Nuclearia_a:178-1146(+)
MSYDNLIHHGRVLTETRVVDVTASEVVTHTGERVSYDYLVVATGSSYRGFIKAEIGIEASLERMGQIRAAVAKPNGTVVVIGAGLAGVEFAGELKSAFPQSKVTIVDSNKSVLGAYDFPPAFRSDVEGKLRALGVELLLGERLILPDGEDLHEVKPRRLQLESGKEIDSDAQIFSIGNPKPNSAFLASTVLGPAIDPASGRLKLNPSLQVEGFTNVFSMGDVGNVAVLKSAYRSMDEATHLAGNLLKLLANPKAALKPYKPSPPHDVAIISLNAQTGGAAGLPFQGWSFRGGFGNFVSRMKGGDLFLGEYSKMFKRARTASK